MLLVHICAVAVYFNVWIELTCCRGESVAVKIESTNSTEASRLFGRHFDFQDEIVSKISRESINALKKFFRDEMTRLDWELIIKLKKTFKID